MEDVTDGNVAGAGGTTELGSTEQTPQRPRRSSQLGAQLTYGGVEFEVLADFDRWALPEGQAQYVDRAPSQPPVGQVRCAVSGDPALESEAGNAREIAWHWNGEQAEVQTGRVRADLMRLVGGRYAATARTTPDDSGVSALITALTGAVVYREGGLVLHAAGVELDGKAILFIGPESAGKTTACNHTPGAQWFARDRAAIVPGAHGWSAWGMAGGDPVVLPRAPQSSYRLSGILRVRRAEDEPGVHSLKTNEAIGVLRESVQTGGRSRADEDRCFDAMTTLASTLPVGEVRTRLEEPITDLLRDWLKDGTS